MLNENTSKIWWSKNGTRGLITATVALMLNRLTNGLVDDVKMIWYLHDAAQTVALFGASLAALELIPFRHLMMKCVAAALTASMAFDCVWLWAHYVLGVHGYLAYSAIQAVAVISAVFLYVSRSYNEPSDALDEEHVFCLRQRPHDAQGLIISMLGMFGPYAGYALYANGILYAYHEGTLTARNIDEKLLKSYHVTRGRKVTPAFHQEMSKWVGSQWTLQRNCLTLLRRIWGQYK